MAQPTGIPKGSDYVTRIVDGVTALGRPAWDALLVADGRDPTPFLRHAFLAALESEGCVGGRSGWDPEFVTLWEGDSLVAAAPAYRKWHSYGEYVFDWAWADAYGRHGLDYYPKLVVAVPFTPVPGPRLLARDEAARGALARALVEHAAAQSRTRRAPLSSLHVLLPDETDLPLLEAQGMMPRDGVQFHWSNPGWQAFDDYLSALSQPKRKKVRAERRRVHEAGAQCRVLTGREIDDAHLAYFHRCYARTYRAHHSTPYLNAAFFARWAREAPDDVVLSLAEDADGSPLGAALLARGGDRLYGRYWGSTRPLPCLHFECAYYAPIEWAIAQGVRTFEGGAQGEHKLARGFLPVRTRSAHWLAHPAFADAVRDFLERETGGVEAYLDELSERLPLRADPSSPPLAPSSSSPPGMSGDGPA